MTSSSARWTINWVDVWKGIRGSLVVFLAAFLVAGWGGIIDALKTADLGQLELLRPFLISGASFVLEELRRLATDYSAQSA